MSGQDTYFSHEMTPAEHERLSILIEEAAEITQVCGKIIPIFGKDYHGDNNIGWPGSIAIENKHDLEREIGNLMHVVSRMSLAGDLDKYAIHNTKGDNPASNLIELTAMVTSACGRIGQLGCKVMRHGYASGWPADNPVRNKHDLEREIGKLLKVIDSMIKADLLDRNAIRQAEKDKEVSIMPFLHHQGDR